MEVLNREMRPGAKVVETVKGAIDLKVLLAMDAAVEDDLDARPSHHDGDDDHDHDDFESFSLIIGDVTDPAALEEKIKAVTIAHDILRVKGFVNVPGKSMRHVIQAVGPRVDRYFDRPWQDGEKPGSHLVVIGQTGMDRDAITAALNA